MIIGLAKMELEERINYIRLFVPRINNWAVCDIFSGELKKDGGRKRERNSMAVYPALSEVKRRI